MGQPVDMERVAENHTVIDFEKQPDPVGLVQFGAHHV
jgi:hypothetical protein